MFGVSNLTSHIKYLQLLSVDAILYGIQLVNSNKYCR